MREEEEEEEEDYVDFLLTRENEIVNAGLNSRVPSRIMHHAWLLQVRNTAINTIVRTGELFGVRQITVYTTMIYVDRFLSLMPIQNERFLVAKLLSIACLFLAGEGWEGYEDQANGRSIQWEIQDYAKFTHYNERSITNMMDSVVEQFGEKMTIVTPIEYIRYFLSKFCKDDSRKDDVKIKTVEVIMSTLGDVWLMSMRPSIVGAAATLLASNPNILTKELIKSEIAVLPKNWLVPLVIDEVDSCYNRLLETNRHRLDIN